MNAELLTQRSAAWFAERGGSLGGSEVYEATAKQKSGKYYAARDGLIVKKALERLKIPTSKYTSAAMQHGIDTEAEARVAYEFARNVSVREVGMFKHNRIAMTHSSPDGMVSDSNVAVEIKCPQPVAHFETIMSGEIPEKYLAQCFWHMACSGANAVDFVSYSPAFPPSSQLFIKRVERENEKIAELEKEVEIFLAEVNDRLTAYNLKFAA